MSVCFSFSGLPPQIAIKMSPINFSSSFSVALCFFFLALYSTAAAFNITEILSQHGDFSNFNNLLTQTKVAEQINSRQTITVLAVANGNLPSGQSNDAIKNALMLHVILDYYDAQKLKNLKSKTALLTTLFQASGNARGQQGFLNVTVTDNEVAFGSAVQGSSLDAKVVGPVASEPYNISVLQVSGLVNPGAAAGNSSSAASPTNSPASSPSKSPAPAASSNSSASPQASSPKSSPSPSASKAPASSTSQPPADSPSSNSTTGTAPAASSPTDSGAAPSPEDSASTPSSSPSDSPVTSPPAASESPVADGPASDTPSTDAPSSGSSGVPPTAVNAGIGIASFLMVLSSAWVLA